MKPTTGSANGVPFVALPPERGATTAPMIIAWHLHDPPRSETAMAAALPLHGVPAWRVYLGLPLSGSRLPAGGLDAFFRLAYDDAVVKVFDPVCRQALEEFPTALAALRDKLPVTDAPLGLLAGSIGALVAQTVLAETDVPVSAVALVSPAIRLATVVTANEKRFDTTYPWTKASRAVAERLDFVARADEIAKRDAAVLLVVGEDDDEENIGRPAAQLCDALSAHAPGDAALMFIPGMAHAIAEEPGLDPAPQTRHAACVDSAVTDWFRRRLTTATA
jgi:pimeloyl-ACP methyl ester carboxylesterase